MAPMMKPPAQALRKVAHWNSFSISSRVWVRGGMVQSS